MRFLSMIRIQEGSGQVPSEQLMRHMGQQDQAIELTRRFLSVHGKDWDVECEVRQLDGPEFGCAP